MVHMGLCILYQWRLLDVLVFKKNKLKKTVHRGSTQKLPLLKSCVGKNMWTSGSLSSKIDLDVFYGTRIYVEKIHKVLYNQNGFLVIF